MNNKFNKNCIIIKGKDGSGKTTLAIDIYKNMIEKEHIPSENILVFLFNSIQSIRWTTKLSFSVCGELNKFTYIRFVNRELKKYWPIVVQNCKDIEENFIKPQFVSSQVSSYIMENIIDNLRKEREYFYNITSTTSHIASSILSDINNAALNLISFKKVSQRLYDALEVKNSEKERLYEDMSETIDIYIKKLLSKGNVDYALSVYLYNEYLLKNSLYQKHLKEKFKYLIVDDFSEISVAQLELIKEIVANTKKSYLFFNPLGGNFNFKGSDVSYIENYFNVKYNTITLNEHFMCTENFINTAKMLCSKINNEEISIKENIPVCIDMSSQLRSEMILKVALKVEKILSNGKKLEDIAIITPFNDFAINYEIQKKLNDMGIAKKIKTSGNKLIDNLYVHSLIVMACICRKCKSVRLTEDDYNNFFSFLFQIDLVRSSIFTNALLKRELNDSYQKRVGEECIKKYENFKMWIQEYREKEMSLGEFFRRAYLEILIKLPNSKENIIMCKKLFESSERFIDVMNSFYDKKVSSDEFLKFAVSKIKDFDSILEIEQKMLLQEDLNITTPYTYITSSMNNKIQIWVDINSEMWSPRNIKNLSNNYVIKKSWEEEKIYSEELENENRRKNMCNLICRLMRKCSEKVYMYGSQYSINGYEQENILASDVMEIINEKDELNG